MDMDCIWCIIIPALLFLLGALLGYLLGRFLSSEKDNTEELDNWKAKYAKLEKQLEDCNAKINAGSNSAVDLDMWKKKSAALETDLAACRAEVASNKMALADFAAAASAAIVFDSDAAKAVFGKKIIQDDLKVVEGIGPKIEGLFHSFGIKTWKALSESTLEKRKEVLNSGGERYKIHNPGSWGKQAKMAYEGKWEELLKWQDEHNNGIE